MEKRKVRWRGVRKEKSSRVIERREQEVVVLVWKEDSGKAIRFL